MKYFNIIHEYGFTRWSLFGFTLYKRDALSCPGYVQQVFLGGLVTSKRDRKRISFRNAPHSVPPSKGKEKRICIAGIPAFVRREDGFGISASLFGITVNRQSWEQILKEKIVSRLPAEKNDLWLLNAHSGEIFLTLNYLLPALMERRPGWMPTLATPKAYHLEMARMICPEIPCIRIKNRLLEKNFLLKLPSPAYEVDGRRVLIPFTSDHFHQVEETLTTSEPTHYFHAAARFFGLEASQAGHRGVRVPEDMEASALQKAAGISLDTSRFIFFAPEAASIMELPDEFWLSLAEGFRRQGFDIFVNASSKAGLAEQLGRTCPLTFGEAFALARKARRIVALRSGFIEFLMEAGVPMDVVYTGFDRRGSLGEVPAHAVHSGFTLSQLPGFDGRRVREFIAEQDALASIQQAILQKEDLCSH